MRDKPARQARRVYDAAAAMPWAITPEYLRLILAIAARENQSIEAVEAELGRPLDNTRAAEVRDGVAVIPVAGPIFRYASIFARVSGATSIQDLALDFTSAVQNPNVSAILLNIDSPGGEVSGTSEFAQMVYDARGTKPVVAYVDGMGCSAAYWIASAADTVMVADTAVVGSIGVIATYENDPDGAEPIQIVSSRSPDKNPDPATSEGRAKIQTTLDALADVFIGAVARNRGVTADTVLSDFGRGGVFVGADAVTAGLVDGVSRFESVLASVAKGESPAPRIERAPDVEPEIAPVSTVAGAPDSQHQPAAPAATDDSNTNRRTQHMNPMDWIRSKAAAEGVELDEPAPEAPAAAAPIAPAVLPGTSPELEAALNELAALRAEKAEQEKLTAQMLRDTLTANVTSAVAALVADKRLTPGAGEQLGPIVARIAVAEGSSDEGSLAAELLGAISATTPDLGLFTSQQVHSDEAVAVIAGKAKTDIPGAEKESLDRQEKMLAATPAGRAVLAARKAAEKAAAK